MKKNILIVIALLSSFGVFAQKKKQVVNANDTAVYWTVYRNAVMIGDPVVARNSLYEIIARAPSCVACFDSLAQIYFATGDYRQAVTCAEKAGPDSGKTRLLELKAYGYRNIGDLKTSLKYFERLRSGNSNPEYAYQVAAIQFNLKLYGECIITSSSIINNPDAANRKLTITYDSGKSQDISYKAAAHNMRGVAYMTSKKNDKAKEDFEAALALEPEFLLAKNNLEDLNKP